MFVFKDIMDKMDNIIKKGCCWWSERGTGERARAQIILHWHNHQKKAT